MSAISFRFTRVICVFLLHAPTARCKANLANVPTHVVVSPTTCQQTKAAGGIRGMVGGHLQGHAEDTSTGEIMPRDFLEFRKSLASFFCLKVVTLCGF